MKNKTNESRDAARAKALQSAHTKAILRLSSVDEIYSELFDAGIAIAKSQNGFHTQLAYESGYKAAESQGDLKFVLYHCLEIIHESEWEEGVPKDTLQMVEEYICETLGVPVFEGENEK